MLLVTSLLAACGNHAGTSSPTAAVSAFLAPFGSAVPRPSSPKSEDERRGRLQERWRAVCRRVDPAIRKGLRFYPEGNIDPLVNCGAGATFSAMYTGESNEMAAPSAMTGTPLSARTSDDTSIVTVAMRYRTSGGASTAPAPPAQATIKVLAVRRDGEWFVATPGAVNPLHARDGGLSERQLRAAYRDRIAAAK
jgi:hypothetical protein